MYRPTYSSCKYEDEDDHDDDLGTFSSFSVTDLGTQECQS